MATTQKAKLTKAKGETASIPDIEFMFNPSELTFETSVQTASNPGGRSEETGKPRVSFSNIQPYKITINNILFDNYETGENVLGYIESFKEAVKFVENNDTKRPPVYRFIWGEQVHLEYCFVERLSYKLTMFKPDGIPIRAVINNLTLTQIDPPDKEQSTVPPPKPDPENDNMKSRKRR